VYTRGSPLPRCGVEGKLTGGVTYPGLVIYSSVKILMQPIIASMLILTHRTLQNPRAKGRESLLTIYPWGKVLITVKIMCWVQA
jgi:hypothetical protein